MSEKPEDIKDPLVSGIINPHRDDIPMEIAEGIEALLKKHNPGTTQVVFSGDTGSPEGTFFREAIMKAFIDGCCFYCGQKMPGVNEEDWKPAEGWDISETGGKEDDPLLFECPKCQVAAPKEGETREIHSPYLEETKK